MGIKAKILVVDDKESIRFTLKRFLADEGYGVVTAGNYNEALAKISEGDIDLIFADIILGGKTGIDLLKEVNKRRLGCPVVMITGAPSIETATDTFRQGAFDYILKPVRQESLIHAADMALRHKALQDENQRYRSNLEAIFRSVKDAIITVDNDLRMLEINEAAKNICGYFRSDIGRDIRSLHRNCNGKCLEALLKTINERRPVEVYRIECRHRKRTAQVVKLSASPLLNNQGNFYGAVLVAGDETRLAGLERGMKKRRQFHNIIGQSTKMQEIYSLVEALADVQTTVLITGESGTGKELVAEALHYKGERSRYPLVKVNCAALSESLLESELFGHVKGAFTGAGRDMVGRFQRADGGTIFLDEIGDISPKMQLRLLRVLQEKEFERVGESTPIKVNVRVVAATNQDLSEKIRLGEFRKDLYYRLKVMEIFIPPLRQRRDDIPMLVNHFLKKFNNKFNKEIMDVSEDVRKIFMNYPWPGNVRELEHMLEHAFILCRQSIIAIDHLPHEIKDFDRTDEATLPGDRGYSDYRTILQALEKTGWNKSRAARLLRINVRTIYRKMEKHKIMDSENSKP